MGSPFPGRDFHPLSTTGLPALSVNVNLNDWVRLMLSYERLDVYQRTIEFLSLVLGAIEDFPPGQSAVRDQLKRAAMSIPLNIAEGVGRTSRQDAKRFYAIARGSAMESGAVIDVCRLLGLINEESSRNAKALLERIVAMLSRTAL